MNPNMETLVGVHHHHIPGPVDASTDAVVIHDHRVYDVGNLVLAGHVKDEQRCAGPPCLFAPDPPPIPHSDAYWPVCWSVPVPDDEHGTEVQAMAAIADIMDNRTPAHVRGRVARWVADRWDDMTGPTTQGGSE